MDQKKVSEVYYKMVEKLENVVSCQNPNTRKHMILNFYDYVIKNYEIVEIIFNKKSSYLKKILIERTLNLNKVTDFSILEKENFRIMLEKLIKNYRYCKYYTRKNNRCAKRIKKYSSYCHIHNKKCLKLFNIIYKNINLPKSICYIISEY